MSDERLAEIRARVAEASPAPWSVDISYRRNSKVIALVQLVRPPVAGSNIPQLKSWQIGDLPNLMFIANSRADVPELLAEVDRLRALVARKPDKPAFSAVDKLVRTLGRKAELGTCWILRRERQCALIVPMPDGSFAFMCGARRATIDAAERDGLVVIGDRLVDVRPYSGGGDQWSWDGGYLKGRTIALAPKPSEVTA